MTAVPRGPRRRPRLAAARRPAALRAAMRTPPDRVVRRLNLPDRHPSHALSAGRSPSAGRFPSASALGVSPAPFGRDAPRGFRHGLLGFALVPALLLAGFPGAAAGQPPEPAAGPLGLGRPATAGEIAALDIDVRPDGAGLPLGGGTAADGARVWTRACRACHGREGEGGIAAPLVGRDAAARPPTVGNYWPYATTLYDYVYRAMPRNAPGTLTPDEVYGLVAWILEKNGIIDDQAVMNAATLPDVVMPARGRFVPDDRLESDAVR